MTWDGVAIIVKAVSGKREAELAGLIRQFRDQGIEPEICYGTLEEPPRDNLRRLLGMAAASGRPYFAHVEDDAYLAPDFAGQALLRLQSDPDCMWTFYNARKEVRDAYRAGKDRCRITPSAFANTQFIVLPASHLSGILAYLPEWEARHPEHRSAVDYFFGAYCRQAGLRIYAAAPSLVQHLEIPSLLGPRASCGRISRAFREHYGEIGAR